MQPGTKYIWTRRYKGGQRPTYKLAVTLVGFVGKYGAIVTIDRTEKNRCVNVLKLSEI